MIRKLFHYLFKKPNRSYQTSGEIFSARKFKVYRQKISPGALHVVRQLQKNGYSAYIVGGAVRDILLGLQPKDFDVATNATPEEVKRQFHRARIIGKRFRIVHVPAHQGEIIEVTTFRGDSQAPTDASGRILHDNEFGSMEEDAKRRDFTCNALYYDPFKELIVDYHHGMTDICQRKLVMIGNPTQRYREDPVRILRAIRLSTKLGIMIDSATQQAIKQSAALLENIPRARLFDETLKIFHSGQSLAAITLLRQEELHHYFFPLLDRLFAVPQNRTFIENALHNTDLRIKDNKPISSGFLFAVLLWPEVIEYWKKAQETGEHSIPALFAAMDEVLNLQEQLAIPRRFSGQMKEIWMLQPRFEQRKHNRVFRLLMHPRFRAGYDFLLLRASADPSLQELGNWWTAFQHADAATRENLLESINPPHSSSHKKRRKKSTTKARPITEKAE